MGMSGGSSSSAPVAPTYTDPVNGVSFSDTSGWNTDNNTPYSGGAGNFLLGPSALNAEIAYRQSQEKAASDAKAAALTSQNATSETGFQNSLSAAAKAATDQANTYFTQQGYDPNKFAAELARVIGVDTQSVGDPYANWNPTTGTAAGTPGTNGANPMAAFSPNIGANIIADVTSGDSNQASNKVNQLFSPTYSQDNISNSWLDPAATSALSSQFDPLTSQLTNALKRGTLNQTGYDAANTKLGQDRTAAQSTVHNLGTNILAADRTGLDSYITGAKNDAASVNPTTFDSFDPNKYATGAADKVAGYKNNFAGDLQNAIGSTSFSDLSSLLNAGGAVQGATDPTATNPTAGKGGAGISDAYIAQQALAKENRGLGSSGAF